MQDHRRILHPFLQWPLEYLSEVPVNCLDGRILVEGMSAEFATFKASDQLFNDNPA